MVLWRHSSFSHGLSLHFDFVGVVNEPIEDHVGDGSVPDHLAPFLDREVTGDRPGGWDGAWVASTRAFRLGLALRSRIFKCQASRSVTSGSSSRARRSMNESPST